MVFYEVCNLYEEHYEKYYLIRRLKASNFTYFGILHNRDYFPTGEPKKSHFHLILGVEGDSRHTKDLVIKFFNDSSLLFRYVRNPKGYCRYLTHKDNLEKCQYLDSEVFTNDKTLYEELVQVQLKMSITDNLLKQFESFVLSNNFDFNNQDLCCYEWFRDKGKVDYYLRNYQHILNYISLIIQLYNIKGD